MEPIPGDLIRPIEAALLLKVCDQTVYKYIERGILPAWKRRGSRCLHVSRADVEALLEPVAVKPKSERLVATTRQQSAMDRRADEILKSAGLL